MKPTIEIAGVQGEMINLFLYCLFFYCLGFAARMVFYRYGKRAVDWFNGWFKSEQSQ